MKKCNRIVLIIMFVFLVIIILCFGYEKIVEKKFGGEFISVDFENDFYYVTTETMVRVQISKETRYIQYVVSYTFGFSFLFLMFGISYFWIRYLVIPSAKNALIKFKKLRKR